MVSLRVGTYNILNGLAVASGQVRDRDLHAAITALDTDIVALQEVDYGQLRSGRADQAAIAADAVGARSWRFAPSLIGDPSGRWEAVDLLSSPDEPSYGIALVSRIPLHSWQARAFPAASVPVPLKVAGRRGLTPVNDHPRTVLAAVADTPEGSFTVAAAHLSFVPGWNVRQLRAITRWLATMPAPHVLLGDLNLPGNVPARVTRWFQLARTRTYPSWRPRVQWDHALASAAVTAHATTTHRLAVSDHAALTVDIDLEPGT
ncbi:endonuclease/exonuclease/phosphatase family protein [Phytoactinopolyspora halophila]|uniref:endonuclease/exonuclease/phosphatase family protein n=1 Tax=Phytoactinopolyspora halophila TaxID=1981511 RepID=UPI0013143CE0|nr:endonuclease/exonuclease/phosphatase family protein [Phytoactinopolyspora halophila]